MRQIVSCNSPTIPHISSSEIRYLLPSHLASYSCLVSLAGHFTERERNRILGHQGSALFEKYYHDNCIRRDIQNVVLLRPSQENLCRAAAQMNRHRDHLAPSDLTDNQLEGIRNHDQIRRLQEKRLALKKEMRALYGTLKKAKGLDPDRFKEHEVVVRELTRVRSVHRR